jgi:hypothetical protein
MAESAEKCKNILATCVWISAGGVEMLRQRDLPEHFAREKFLLGILLRDGVRNFLTAITKRTNCEHERKSL